MLTNVTANSTIRVAMKPRPRDPAKLGHGTRLRRRVAGVAVALAISAVTMPTAVRADSNCALRLRPVPDPSGEGYAIRDLGLWLAGDLTVVGSVPEGHAASIALDDLDLLVRYEPFSRLSLFSEVRLEETFRVEDDEGLAAGSGNLSIERLYADLALTPTLTLRAGKFLTPFGLWNVIWRAPLTWTVERPVITEDGFPDHTTGLGLIYQTTRHGWTFDATAYGPAQDELPLRSESEAGLMFGGRISAGHQIGAAYAAIGANGAGFEDDETHHWADVSGVDLDVSVAGNKLTGEFAYKHLNGPDVSREWGWYVQDVIPVRGPLYLIARAESFHGRRGRPITGGLAGLFWRPKSYLVLKLDYQFADRRSEDDLQRGLVMSIGLFF